nr:MAG TPA: hypothetical protein [Caudoviricetes sp.]
MSLPFVFLYFLGEVTTRCHKNQGHIALETLSSDD